MAAALVGHDSRQYSWWWVSHISPKNSKWLQENLNDMDTKVNAMIKLINEDADSFARRAEMYYKKRPELMKLVEEFYRAYRALAERYDQATGALRQAHRTISEAFPNQMPSMPDESPSSSGQEVEPHTPEMPTFARPPFDSDDLQKDGVGVSPQHFTSKRNGTHPEEISALPNRKGLKPFNDLSLSSENAPRAVFDGKVRKGLSFESPEVKGKDDISNELVNFQQEISRLLAENQNMKQQILSESERANKAESEIQSLKDTVLQLNSEKDASLLQYNQSTERLCTLESELSKAQADLQRLTDEMATEVQKLNSAETRNSAILSELESLGQKVKMQQQELEQNYKELESFHLSFQEEHEKRLQAESALLSEGKERAQSQEEVQRLTIEIKMANEKLNELMQTKVDLDDVVCELKKEVKSLTEQNYSSELLIQELHDEINSLKDSKNELQSEIQSLKSTISQLNTEKDAALLQHQKSVERVSVLESQLLKLQSELDEIEQKVHILIQDLEQKREEADSVHAQLQDECHKRTQTEAALLTAESLHSQLQEEVEKLTQDLDRSTKKLSKLENDKLDLENTSRELKNTILDLSSEKDAALLQQWRSLEKVSALELQLSQTQLELEKSEQKMQLLELEIAQKSESVDSLKLSLKHEAEKRVQAEKSVMSVENMHSQSQEEVSRLHLEIEKLNGKLNDLENSSSELKNTIVLLNTEKDATLLKNQQSSVRISNLESELEKLQVELEKVEGKVQMLEQELKHKKEEVDSLQISLQHEAQKRIEGEAALLSMTNLHSDSQEEVNRLALDLEQKREEADSVHAQLQDECHKRTQTEAALLTAESLHSQLQEGVEKLTQDLDRSTKKLSKLENDMLDLENTSRELKNTILDLSSEKDAALLQQQRSLEKVSDLELQLSETQLELEKSEQKMLLLELEIAQKSESVDSLKLSLKHEAEKRVQAEKSVMSVENMYSQSQEEVSRLHLEIEKLNGKLNDLENSSSELKNTIVLLNTEKDATLLKNQQSSVRVSNLESELEKLPAELEKVEGKVQMLEQELKHKKEEVDSLQISLQHEAQKLIEGEAALLSMTNLHSDSQEEVNRLALEIEKLTGKLSEVENSKMDLENIVTKHTEDIHILREQNLYTELIIKDLHRELDALKELNVKLETEVWLHIVEKESLQRDFACQREEKENLEGIHHALADEMASLKSSTATNQKLIEELQIMNLKLKEACEKSEVEKALLSEKVQEVEKLSEEYLLSENSLSDANAEMDALREKIKVLEASESSLKDVVSSHVFEKAVLASELETLGKSFADISEKNSILYISLSNMKAELEALRTKLKDSEEICQAHLDNNSALSAEKNNVFCQLESVIVVMKALKGKHADLEDKHSTLSIEKDLVYDQIRELHDQLRIKNVEYEAAVKSHQMEVNSFEEHISSLREKTHYMDEMLEQEEQKHMSASISVVILENCLVDVKDKNFALFSKCQKYAEANHTADVLILQLKDEAQYHEVERKTLLMHTEKLREGISQHMKVLNIYKDLGPANIAHDKILLQTVSDETFNILKLKEESEDANRLMYTELLVLATVLLQVGMELRDLLLNKCVLEKEVESGAAELLSLQNKNQQILECNEQLRQGLKKGSEREKLLKTELLVLQEKLPCLSESYQTSRDEIANLTEKNESLSKENQSLIEKYNALEDENGTFLAECMRLEHLSLFLRGHNNEVASALVSLTDEMALLSLIKGELNCEVQVLSRRTMMLESENNHLKEYFVYLVEILRTQLILSEFDLNTSKSICQELAIELESLIAQLLQKDDELLEAEEKVQFLQEKNRELCGVVGALQVAIEGAKVVKGELEKKISTLIEEGTTKDDEILLLRQANETLQVEANTLKDKEDSLTSAHEFMSKEVEQHEREFVVLMGDAMTSSVNAAVYEEKALKLMMEGKAMEISAIAQKVLLMKEISRDAHIEDLHKELTGLQEENAELKAELSTHLALLASLSDHVNVLEEDTFSLLKPYSTEDKEEAVRVPCMQEGNHVPECHRSPGGTPELQRLIARIEALRVVILNAKDRQDQESTESAAKLAAANIEIQELKARGSSRMEAREIYSDEKQKEAEGSKGKQVQMMKDIELDEISTCPPYGTGTALYPLGNGANAEPDDEMLQLWEAAERSCKNQTAKSLSSEHDIQAVEEVKSEYPSSELARGRDLGINKLEMSTASVEPHEVWSKNVLEKLTSDAQRLLSIQTSIEELERKMGGPSKGKSPINSEYNSVSAQLLETEGYVLEQINFNNKLTKKAENYPAVSDSMNAEREGYSSRRKISEQVQKGSENVARLELELQKIQYVLLKLEEEHEYRRLKVSDKRTRVLLRDYLYGRKDNHGGGQKKKKAAPFCGCVRGKSRTET